MKLRTLLLCVAAALALTLCASAADVVDRGFCGANVMWTLDSDGVLTISGAGAMDDGHNNSISPWTFTDYAPWYEKRDNITTAVINNGVASIGNYAFYKCANLTSVTIPDSVASIGEWAFADCASLTSVTIPDSVTSIGWEAFWGCASLTSVTISNSVTYINDFAFADCTSLTSVMIPDSVTRIGGNAFSGCASLTSVTIPDSVTSIGASAFYGCASLTSVTIPNSVTRIDASAFYGCASLTSVAIPASVTSIWVGAFSGCVSLTAILVDSNNQKYMSQSGILFTKNLSVLISYPAGKTGAYEIPDSVASIGYGAFRGCASLTSVAIPDSVTSIASNVFWGCASLTSVTIPDSVASINEGAFYGCESLTDVYYGGSATQWSEIRISYVENGNDALKNATVHYNSQDVGVGITLTDEKGNAVDGNGQTGDTEETRKNAFQDGAEFTASFDAVDPAASSGLIAASVFIVFYDKDGLMVSLESREIDLSDPLNLLFTLDLRIPEGAKTLKILMLGDNLEPLRAVRMIGSSAA